MKKVIRYFKKVDILYTIFLLIFIFFVSEFCFISISLISQSKNKKILDEKKELKFFDIKNKRIYKFPRTITSMSEINKKEEITFRRDEIGTIYPSDLSNLGGNDNYFLFCGGSTLEASQVKEGMRPPDIFAKNSTTKSLNFARSNQNLKECISKIDDFNYFQNQSNYLKKPSKYILSTNINSLSSFIRDKYNIDKTDAIKINHFGVNSFMKIKEIYKKYNREKLFKKRLSIYEHSILDGCCFAPSEINKKAKNKINLKWDDEILKKEYRKYLETVLSKLEIVREKNNIPKEDIIFSIEPNSFDIPIYDFLRPYWNGVDPRQKLHETKDKKLSNKESAKIINDFDEVYFDVMKEYKYSVLKPKVESFPQWSFFDAVHFTDIGSIFLGNYFYDNLKNMP